MKNWNVIISIFQDGFRRAIRALRKLGPVERSPYHNVLLMAAEDPIGLLEAIERQTEVDPALYGAISRVAPALRSFEFHSAEDFQAGAKQIVMEWLPRLARQSFHVRLHRRGLKHNLRSQDVERDLGEALLEALKEAGTPGSLSFSDPDAVVAIDTIDERVWIGFWTREDLTRHRLLRPD
jgi:tRNA(Ser,Leu) C12 N-acetylase TAN1